MIYASVCAGLLAVGAFAPEVAALSVDRTLLANGSLRDKKPSSPSPPRSVPSGGSSYKDLGGDGTPTSTHTSSGGGKQSGSTGSSASCSASSSGRSFSASSDAAVSAVAEAIATVCKPGGSADVYDVEGPFYDSADAIAKAIAKASADCESSGNAFACASAKGEAIAWASATADAYATAWAGAWSECGHYCDKDALAAATADADATAATFLDLVAEVYSLAEVQVCVKGNDHASADALSKCFARAWAKVSAKAIAGAWVEGKCRRAKADVFVKVVTKADYTTIDKCLEKTSTNGNASADTDADSDATVTDVTDIH